MPSPSSIRLGEPEAHEPAAVGVGGERDLGQRHAIEVDERAERVVGERLAGGSLDLDGRGDLVAGAVGLAHELEGLLDAGGLVGADDDLALALLAVAGEGAHDVLAALRAGRDLEVVVREAFLLRDALLDDDGALGADELVGDVIEGIGAFEIAGGEIP